MAPPTSTRRQFIALGAISALPLGSGCSTLSSTESDSTLGQITVENSDDTRHTIHVAVEQDSELIYGSSHELKAVSAPENDGDFGSIDSSILENTDWESKTGSWTVYTRVDDQTSWKQHKISTDDGTMCHAMRLKIEDDSSVTSFTPDCDSWPPTSDT